MTSSSDFSLMRSSPKIESTALSFFDSNARASVSASRTGSFAFGALAMGAGGGTGRVIAAGAPVLGMLVDDFGGRPPNVGGADGVCATTGAARGGGVAGCDAAGDAVMGRGAGCAGLPPRGPGGGRGACENGFGSDFTGVPAAAARA